MPKWFVDPKKLKRIRMEKKVAMPELAQHSGISERMLREYERREMAVRPPTIAILETSLGVKAAEFARFVAEDGDAIPAAAAPAPTPQAGIPRTSLEKCVDAERTVTTKPSKRGGVLVLSARILQDIFTAYRVHQDRELCVEGIITSQRGIDTRESRVLKSKAGVGARFNFRIALPLGLFLNVTVHTPTAALTRALQAKLDEKAAVIVRVKVVTFEQQKAGEGFFSFVTAVTDRRPWTLVVEKVL
jgi:hypothetical protein